MSHEQRDADRLQTFWQVLRARQEVLDCDACLESLEKYVRDQLEKHEVVNMLPPAPAHLASCGLCSRNYVRHYETVWGERHGLAHAKNGESAIKPEFIYQDNGDDPDTAVSSRVSQLVQYEPGKIELQFTGDLVRMLLPRTGFLTVRQPGDSARYSQAIIQMKPLPEIGMPVALTAYRDAQQQRLCLIEVIVAPPGENWPYLGGKQVILTVGDRSETAVTDDWGVARFVGIPVSHLPTMHLHVTLSARRP